VDVSETEIFFRGFSQCYLKRNSEVATGGKGARSALYYGNEPEKTGGRMYRIGA
jgi:hypothetical protein